MLHDAEQLILRLQQQGQLDSSGRFTIQLSDARTKIGRYLTRERHGYLTRWARAAWLGGSAYLHLQHSGGQLIVHSPNLLCDVELLPRLFQDSLEARPLAQALLMALEREPSELELTLADPSRTARLTLNPRGTSQLSYTVGGDLEGTYLRLRLANGTRWEQRPEVLALRKAMAYCLMPIYWNRQLVQQDSSFPPAPGPLQTPSSQELVGFRPSQGGSASYRWAKHQLLQWRLRDQVEGENGLGIYTPTAASVVLQEGPLENDEPGLLPCSGLVALYAGSQRQTLTLVHCGEAVEEIPQDDFLPGCQVVADASHLRLDLGGEQVVRDEPFRHLMSWVDSRQASLRAFLQARYGSLKQGDYRSSLAFDSDLHGHHRWDG